MYAYYVLYFSAFLNCERRYAGSLILLFVNLAIFAGFKFSGVDEMWGYRLNIFLAAAWFFFFALLCFSMMKVRPGPPLPRGTNYVRRFSGFPSHLFLHLTGASWLTVLFSTRRPPSASREFSPLFARHPS